MRKIHCTLLITSLLLSACSAKTDISSPWSHITPSPLVELPRGSVLERAGSIAPEEVQSTNLLGSLAPLPNQSPQDRVPAILERGYIIVGVSQSQNLLSYQDFSTGEVNGFEVDLAKNIAQDIFGDPTKIDFRFIDATDQVSALEKGDIDIVINALSITRARQDQLSFSTPYFLAKTQLLTIDSAPIYSLKDLAGKTLCAVFESTGVERARLYAPESHILKVPTWSDCLIALQENQVDAIISDDTILAGMLKQDPTTRIIPIILSQENYGIGIASPSTRNDTEGLIRQVNYTIERIRSDGTWLRLYNQWFAPYLSSPTIPSLNYRQEIEQ